MSNYKYCSVPMCKSTTVKTPEKVFLYVPRNKAIRKKWCKVMKRAEVFSEKSSHHVCEDHFDLEHDVDNYMKYRIMGRNVLLRVKKEVVPHKFECQRSLAPSRCTGAKRERKKIVAELLSTDEPAATTPGIVDVDTPTSAGTEEQQDAIQEIIPFTAANRSSQEKSVQVHIRPQFRSKATNTHLPKVMEKNGEVLIKNCFVQLEMLNLAEYDSDSSLDLPVPAYLRPSKKKSKKKKTSEELLLESQNLADNIAIDTVQNNDMEEKLRTLEIVQFPEPDDESLTPPLLKEEEIHVFSVKDSLQFFSKLDVTPSLCGYKNRIEFTAFEKKILATKNVELEHVISSFLFSSNVYCISDCKSFVTYLLKNLSVYEDVATVNACYNVLIMLLTKHPEAKNLTFSTAQIFMLLFNYGIDINSFQFLQQWSDVMNHLEVPTKCNASRIPNKWTLNLKKILKAVIKLLSTCTFKAADLCKIIVFFLWMCLDSTIVQENLYSVIKECISVCLNRITKDVWIKTLCDIARILLSMEFSSEKEKWKNIAYMTEAIPVDSDKGIQLRKQISFLVLNSICKGDREPESEDRFGFNLCELQHLLRKLKEIDTTLMSSATKFVDMCIRHLNTTTEVSLNTISEEYQDLLKILKHSESHLDETAHEAKRHFATIHFKLSLLVGNKFKMYQVSPHKRTPRKGTPKKIKSEGIEALAESKLISFDLRKVKLEPASDLNRGLRPLEINPSQTNLPSDQINDATVQNDNDTNLEFSNEQNDGDISDSLLLLSKNVVIKKELSDDSYENSEHFSKSTAGDMNSNEIFDASENLELTPTIIVKKEHIDEENLELMSCNIVEKEQIDNEDYIENNEVIFEHSIVKVNVKKEVSNNLDGILSNIFVKKEHTDVDIEDTIEQSASSGDDEQFDSLKIVENINDPVIVAKDSICDSSSVNSADLSSEYFNEIVDNTAVTQAAISDSNVQESGMKDSLISLVSSISTETPIVIEAFSVTGSELVEVDYSSHLPQDLAHMPGGDTLQEEDNATFHLRDESKSILIDDNFKAIQKSQHKDFGDSSEMHGSGEESQVTELAMHAGEENINTSSYETKLQNVTIAEVPVSHWIETCMDEEIFKDCEEEVIDKTNEVEAKTSENHILYVNVISSGTNNHCGEILNDVLSSVDAVTDICVNIIASEAVVDESPAMTIETGHFDQNIDADAKNLLNNQVNSVYEQNKYISSCLKTKQRSKKNSYSSMSNDLKSAMEDDVRGRKKVLVKRKQSSLDWCKSLTKKYKVKHVPVRKHIKEFKVHNIDRDVADTLESVVTSSVASCQSPTSLRKSVSDSVVEGSESFVKEFNSFITVRESSDMKAVKYPLSKILSGEHSMLKESRSCPSTPVHFSGVQINRKRKLSESHNLSSSLMKNNFVSKLKELDDGSLANQKKSKQSVIVSPKKSLLKFSPRKAPLKFSPKKSPHKFFDYVQRKQKYVTLSRQKRQTLLSKTGVNLANILKEKLTSDASTDKAQTVVSLSSDDSDSDVVELYVDPKRFADKECMIIYESPEQIVIDSD